MLNFIRKYIGSAENPSRPITADFFLGASTADSGVHVTPESAMRCSAVWASVRLLASSISTLPVGIYRRGADGQRTDGGNHAIARLLQWAPNSEIDAIVWLDNAMHDLVLRNGNHFSIIRRNQRGDPVELIPIEPYRIDVVRQNGQKMYGIKDVNGRITEYRYPSDMIHICGPGYDSKTLRSMPVISAYRQAVGAGLSAESHGAYFFKNGGRHPGLISKEGTSLNEEASKKAFEMFSDVWGGAKNSGRPIFLNGPYKYQDIGMSNADAQFIEFRKFSVTDIARIFGVPPHMIADLEKATFSNIEHQNINFVQHSIRPWTVRIEREINLKLFPDRTHYAEFKLDGLLRGDFVSRQDGYMKASQTHMTANEIRRLENLPPLPGGDDLRLPVNTQPAENQSTQ